ncbi:hypothetical protein G7Z17_g2633 [Cylindrodendrum hubeiense]|uniref:Uncharacterized protein n=1 Tax=Cylindrodendrum hubeiense TaxID=595255 RepID=A0A9P5HCG6_9HYPO|nr:hypothetical protein G7Z17_g2633 [Cylindrodendrum hubeiense]
MCDTHGRVYDTLYANIGYCTQMGQDIFIATAERMERVGYLALEMSKSGGIIDSMLEYIAPTQSTARDKQLHAYLITGQRNINESIQTISQVKDDFETWRVVTKSLVHVLQEKAENKLRDQTIQEQRLADELEEERQQLEDFERRYENAFEIYQNAVTRVPKTLGSASAMISAAVAAGLAPEIFVAGLALGTINYLFLDLQQRRRKSSVRDLEKETSTLRSTLEQLSGESKSIAEVAALVERTLERLNQLQLQINKFMRFLMEIQKMIQKASDVKDLALTTTWTLEDRESLKPDEKLKEDIRRNGLFMRNRFLIASKYAALYNEVSDLYIIPGIDWVSEICLIDSQDNVIEAKVQEIAEWKERICDNALPLILQREDELKVMLKNLNRDSLRSSERVVPDPES